MGALYNIIAYSLGNLFLGILLTFIGIALMFVLIRLWYAKCRYTAASYLVGGVLFVFLSFQAILLCGAVTIKSYCNNIETSIDEWTNDISETAQLTQEDSQMILERINSEWPLVGYYIGGANFEGHTPATIAKAMTDKLRSYMNRFIFRRIGWSLLFAIIGAVIVIKTISADSSRSGARRPARASYRSRSSRPSVGHTDRRRIRR